MIFSPKSIASLLGSLSLVFLVFVSCDENPTPAKRVEPPKVAEVKPNLIKLDVSLTGANRCASCHQKEVNDWKNSHHEQAMMIANNQSVKGNFNDITVKLKGRESKFYKKGEDFFVTTHNAKGEPQEYKITHTFGIHPLQQYIIEFPNGKKQCLHIAWDDIKKQWYHLYPDTEISDDEWLNWTGGSQNWNSMCADCHSTEVKKNYNSLTNSYETTFKEINVSCEACHGPSEQHILNYLNPQANLGNGENFKSLKREKTPSNNDEIESCARCHSRRGQLTAHYDYKGTYMDHYLPEILREGIYHKDGQILDEVFEYGSFLQSKMYHNNVRCTDCHNPHTNKLRFEDNNLCMQCHSNPPEKMFNSPAHHFHKEGSEGAKCINCHMVAKNYMVIDSRRDHSFRIPRPDQTIKYGTPNACNECHKDKSAEWAKDHIEKVHGKERKPHFSDLLIPGKDRYEPNFESLKKLATDLTQPAIARATALWELNAFPPQMTMPIAQFLLLDKQPIVRYHALTHFSQLPKAQRIAILSPVLNDAVRAVRIEIANILADTTINDYPTELQKAFEKASAEHLEYLNFQADSAGGQMNLGNFHNRKNSPEKAKKAFAHALEIDNHFNMARINLAFMLSLEGKYDEAEKLYLKVTELEPQYAQAWYSLGLLYTEQKKYEKAVDVFSNAIARDPENLRIYYNKALTLQELKLFDEAEKTFIEALSLNLPITQNTADLLFGLIMLQLETKQVEKATQTIGQFVQIFGQKHPYMQAIGQKMREIQRPQNP